MTIKQLYLSINDQTMGQMDRIYVYMLYFYDPGSRISYHSNKRVLIINMVYNTMYYQNCNMLRIGRLASIQILMKLETRTFMTWAVKYCFMSMISFMTGTCEVFISY